MQNKIDFLLIFATIGLLVLGLLTIYSAGNFAYQLKESRDSFLYLRQLQFLIPGLILGSVVLFLDYQKIAGYTWILVTVTLILLAAVLVFGNVRGGARSWFGIGDVGIQPSEIGKLIYIIAFAKFLDWTGQRIQQLRFFLLAILVQIPFVLLILMQPDPGTALIYILITFAMLFVSSTQPRYIVSLLGMGLITLLLGVIGLENDFIHLENVSVEDHGAVFITFVSLFNFLHEYASDITGMVFVGGAFFFVFLFMHLLPNKSKVYLLGVIAVAVVLNLLFYILFPVTVTEDMGVIQQLYFGVHTRSFFILNLIPLLASIFIFQLHDRERLEFVNRIKQVYLTFGLGFLFAALLIFANEATDSALIKPHIIDRFTSFMGLTEDYQDVGYDTRQNTLAIGSGWLYGQGFTKGPHAHAYVTERATDYAFTVFAEDMGYIWVLVLFGLFGLVFYRAVQIIYNARDYLGSFIATGILTLFVSHFFINVGMCVGIMPIIGIPLFFVSSGGSNLLTGLTAIALLLNIESRKHVY
jgi:cell division protein FtsW (lipid II flippase)